MSYFVPSLALLVLASGTALYLTRRHWLPPQFHQYVSVPTGGTFADDLEAGLSSSNFDLSQNIDANDSRSGLDGAAKREILLIMKKRRMQFDDARKVYMEQKFAANGIGADGRPRDPKFVSFS
ncbi:hypothetical protein QBC42DRAFT_279141 [Cladorrhinum samala]|uniref:Uncharacterized protein n=1 Tax=Cladorrhinum samala TaxID=585594 RepID=A0AAV9H9I4_9PEZI|nr:hypothetical protein QBC42DRAFT_279141 [Cladorrhinum samala]